MKAIQGEVPLDIVIPNMQSSTSSNDEDIIGVLTKEGISRESSDGMELYRYLRELNPKSNQAFGYNEVVIRNINTRLNTLKVDQELRVQITYTERKENYIPASYNIKLLGVFPIQAADSTDTEIEIPEDVETDTSDDNTHIIPKSFTPNDPDEPVYKTTNTLEKLIVFTRTLQAELEEAKQTIAFMIEKVQFLDDERQRYREQENLLQDILNRLDYLESFDTRINTLENDRHQIDMFKQTLLNYFSSLNRMTQSLLNEVNDEPDDTIPQS